MTKSYKFICFFILMFYAISEKGFNLRLNPVYDDNCYWWNEKIPKICHIIFVIHGYFIFKVYSHFSSVKFYGKDNLHAKELIFIYRSKNVFSNSTQPLANNRKINYEWPGTNPVLIKIINILLFCNIQLWLDWFERKLIIKLKLHQELCIEETIRMCVCCVSR